MKSELLHLQSMLAYLNSHKLNTKLQRSIMNLMVQCKNYMDKSLFGIQNPLSRIESSFDEKDLLHTEYSKICIAYKQLIGGNVDSMSNRWEQGVELEMEQVVLDGFGIEKVVKYLRKVEHSNAFRRGLLRAQYSMISNENSEYQEQDHFTYGSTLYHTWRSVLLNSDCIQSAIAVFEKNENHYVVFGSSTGLLAYFGMALLPLHCTGIEILPFLHDIAALASDQLKCKERITFICQDMLEVDISNAGIIVLTSQCWQINVIRKVYEKLNAEAMVGCIVVDYRNDLEAFTRFECIEVKYGQVSWNVKQAIYVLQCIGPLQSCNSNEQQLMDPFLL